MQVTATIVRHLNVHTGRYAAEHLTVVSCGVDLASWLIHNGMLEGAAKWGMLFGAASVYLSHCEERRQRFAARRDSEYALFSAWRREHQIKADIAAAKAAAANDASPVSVPHA